MFPVFWVGACRYDFDQHLIGAVGGDGDVFEEGGEVGVVVDEEVFHFGEGWLGW